MEFIRPSVWLKVVDTEPPTDMDLLSSLFSQQRVNANAQIQKHLFIRFTLENALKVRICIHLPQCPKRCKYKFCVSECYNYPGCIVIQLRVRYTGSGDAH